MDTGLTAGARELFEVRRLPLVRAKCDDCTRWANVCVIIRPERAFAYCEDCGARALAYRIAQALDCLPGTLPGSA